MQPNKMNAKARQTSSKVTVVVELLQCEIPFSQQEVENTMMTQYRLRHTNAILLSGQRCFSGENKQVFEFCCGGYKGWTRMVDHLHDQENVAMTSQGGADIDPTCIDMCIRHERFKWSAVNCKNTQELKPVAVNFVN